MDYTVHGILQAKILEWEAYPFSRGSCWPRNQTRVSCIAGRSFTNWDIREANTFELDINNSKHLGRALLLIIEYFLIALSFSPDRPNNYEKGRAADYFGFTDEKTKIQRG